jgi:hypothetical protein
MIVVDEKTSGTGGGTFTSGSYITRDLNTVRQNSIISASLSANQISLPAGTYYINASAPAYNVAQHKIRWRSTTNTVTIVGTSEYARSTSTSDQTRSCVTGIFTITTTTLFVIEHRTSTSYANSYALGAAVTFGDVEVYTIVEITRLN